jgi:hypothetical protein
MLTKSKIALSFTVVLSAASVSLTPHAGHSYRRFSDGIHFRKN